MTTTSTSTPILLAQTLATTTTLLTAGTILSLSVFDSPLLASTARSTKSPLPSPASTLPAIRFIFSRGSHLIPQSATVASSLYLYLWYSSPSGVSNASVTLLARLLGVQISQRTGYLIAAVLSASIMPMTGIMLPAANQRLRELAALEERGRGEEVDREELKVMVQRFGWLNAIRGGLMALGGLVGVVTLLG